MTDRKIKITIEESGEVVSVLKGGAVQCCVLQENQTANVCYGSMNAIDAANMVKGMRLQEDRLKNKYGALTIEMLLAIGEHAEMDESDEVDTVAPSGGGG